MNCRVPVPVAARMRGALNLNSGKAVFCLCACRRQPDRKSQVFTPAFAPTPISSRALARLVPALHEVVVDICNAGTGQFDADIMVLTDVVLASWGMTGADQRMRIEIETPDECRLPMLTRVDKPGLLVLAEPWVSAVPAQRYLGAKGIEKFKMLWGTPERPPP